MDPEEKNIEIARLAQRVMELELQLKDGAFDSRPVESASDKQAPLPGLESAAIPKRRNPKGRRRSDVMGDYVLGSMGDGVVGCNERGQITMINPAAIEIMKMSSVYETGSFNLLQIPDELGPLEQEAWFEHHIFYAEDKRTPIPAEELPLSKACRGQTVEAQEIYVLRCGTQTGTWISVNARPLIGPDGTMIGGVSVFRDISERKATEELRARLVAIINAAPDFIATTSATGDLLYVNGAGKKLLGISPSEDISKIRFVDLHTEEAIERLELEALPAALRDGVWRGENSFKRADGTKVPISQVIVVHRTPEQKVEFLSCISTDMTEKKAAASALARRAEALARSNAELEQFASVAAHDLQEPLRTLAGFAELLSSRTAKQLDDASKEFINQIANGVGRMQELVRDLLAYSKVDVARQTLKPINTEEVLHQALRNLQSSIESKGALIEHTAMPTITASESQIRQVFQNLIGNGIKFSSEKEVRVRISATPANEGWVFCVEDNGIGIEPRFIDRIFRIFERLHTRTEFPGTGVGLAVCKKVIERHGGRIWVESELGEGARFLFWLPSSPEDYE